MVGQGTPDRTFTIPFVGGLMTTGDKRAKNPPMLDICSNVEFDETGGLRTRYPFTAGSFTTNILDGGTIANARQLVANGDELLLFTKDTLYAWDFGPSKWVPKGTHLAVKTSETRPFGTTNNQYDCDRAEALGVVAYTWTEGIDATTTKSYISARDKTTGVVIQTPVQFSGYRTRVVAVTGVFLVFYVEISTNDLKVFKVDPTSVSSTIASGIASPTTVYSSGSGFNLYYDVDAPEGFSAAYLAMRLSPTGNYRVLSIDGTLAITAVTKARTCDGPIAISVSPDVKIQIIRSNGGNLQGDLLNAALSDTFTGQAIGTIDTACNQIAARHRSVQDSGQYRCYVFWSSNVSAVGGTGSGWRSRVNWVDTNNTIGTQATFVRRLDIASRAFDNDGRVFVWGIFLENVRGQLIGGAPASQLENGYFLYRDDGFLCAKAVLNQASDTIATPGRLPGVGSTGQSTFSWCGTYNNILTTSLSQTDIAANTNVISPYGDKSPVEITFTFDSNEARRTVRIGETLYIACGEGLLQYDGIRLAEVGFHQWPWYLEATTSAGGGSIEAGTYSYKASYRSNNAKGEIDRSASVQVENVTFGGAPPHRAVFDYTAPLYITHKIAPDLAVEVWRTPKNPTADTPFYLVTSRDPVKTTNPDRYLANDTTVDFEPQLQDDWVDSDLLNFVQHPGNGAAIENFPPPPATVIAADQTRIFLGNVAGDPDRVWYSKQRNNGEVVAFNGSLVVDVPREGGAITGLAFLNETLIVFRQRAIYALPGEGFDNARGGSNYGPARLLSLDVGATNQESIAVIPGGLLFKSDKGWQLLTRAWTVEYVGDQVAAYDSETPLAVQVVTTQHQVRVLTASRMLIWDYRGPQWGEWTISGGLGATIWRGAHLYLSASGVKQQQTTYTGVDYGFDVETAWIKINDLQGRGLVRRIELLGEYRGAHSLKVRLSRNYLSDGAGGWSYHYNKTWTVTPMTVGGPEQLKIAPNIKRPIQAIKVRLTALATDKVSQPSGETAKLTGLSLAVADEPGLYQGFPSTQAQ